MFLKLRTFVAVVASSVALFSISGCDACRTPGNVVLDDLVGTYTPDKRTQAIFTELGLERNASIEITQDGSFALVDMPTIWRDWDREEALAYEQVQGKVGLPGPNDLPFTLDVTSINSSPDVFFFAGSSLCSVGNGMSIQFSWRGHDVGDYLVFVQNET